MNKLPLYRKDNLALIENLKAFAIFFCASHLPQGSMFPELGSLGNLFGGAGVPLFVMLSAYFMKADFDKKNTVFVENVFSIYLWICTFYTLFGYFVNTSGMFDARAPLFHNGGVFYLELLIIWRMVVPYMLRLRKWLLYTLLVVMFATNPMVPKSLFAHDFILAFNFYTPFFLAGLSLDWKNIVTFRDSPKKYYTLFLIVPILILGYISIAFYLDFNEIFVLFPSIRRFITSFAIIVLCFGFFPGSKIAILHRIGTKCLIIYLFHAMLLTWWYGHYLYPIYVEPYCSGLATSLISFAAYCLTFYILSFDFGYKIFFKLTAFVKKSLFRVGDL